MEFDREGLPRPARTVGAKEGGRRQLRAEAGSRRGADRARRRRRRPIPRSAPARLSCSAGRSARSGCGWSTARRITLSFCRSAAYLVQELNLYNSEKKEQRPDTPRDLRMHPRRRCKAPTSGSCTTMPLSFTTRASLTACITRRSTIRAAPHRVRPTARRPALVMCYTTRMRKRRSAGDRATIVRRRLRAQTRSAAGRGVRA